MTSINDPASPQWDLKHSGFGVAASAISVVTVALVFMLGVVSAYWGTGMPESDPRRAESFCRPALPLHCSQHSPRGLWSLDRPEDALRSLLFHSEWTGSYDGLRSLLTL